MRTRQQSGPIGDAQSAALVTREFAPADLDIDDLAEAIRRLLGPGAAPPIRPPDQANSKLLSLRKRGSHGVEAEAP